MYFREVATSLYAWDLLDEGVERILDNVQELALSNSTYLVALMHDEKRPLTDFYYPHNPRRLVYWTEDSRAYWQPNPAAYSQSRVQPRLTDNDELKGRDWLQELIDASRRRNMYTGAELSHTWIDKERVKEEFPDIVQRNIHGNPIDQRMCFNHPDVRSYGIALYTDLVANYDIDMVQTCVRGFAETGPTWWRGQTLTEIERLLHVTFGGCFCEHCERKARNQYGIAWDEVVERLRWIADGFDRFNARQAFDLALLTNSSASVTSLLIDTPELYTWLKFRSDSLTEFYAEIYAACHAVRDNIDVRLNHYAAYPEMMGLDLKGVAPYLDSVRSSDYQEQSGNIDRVLGWKRGYLHTIRRAIGVEKYFTSAVSPRPKATPEIVRAGVRVSAECGANGLTIGHYDGSWLDCLKAVKEGLNDAGIVVVERDPSVGPAHLAIREPVRV
jgi:hypothetical protein